MIFGRPESISKIENGPDTVFVKKLFRPMAFFFLLFCIVWDGFLTVWYMGVFSKNISLFALLFPVLHVVTGIGLTYYTIALFINRIEIVIGNGIINIKDIPLPLGNTNTYNGDDFQQFYVREKIVQGRRTVSVSYIIMGLTKSGVLRKIVGGFTDKDEGDYLVYEFEKILGFSHLRRR